MNKKNRAIIWVYSTMLILGGLIGFTKSGSLASLIMSSSLGAILMGLTLFAKRIRASITWTTVVLLFIDSFFTYRFLKTWKFMPAGAFALITFAALIAFIKVSDPLQNRARRGP